MDSWTDCKLFYFLFRFGRQYSSMLLVLMSLISKCFAVYFPLKSKTICTVKTGKWATGIVGIVLVGYNYVYFCCRISILKSSGCHTWWLILEVLDSILYSFGTFTLMFITHFSIGLNFIRTSCQNYSSESTSQALTSSSPGGQL